MHCKWKFIYIYTPLTFYLSGFNTLRVQLSYVNNKQ